MYNIFMQEKNASDFQLTSKGNRYMMTRDEAETMYGIYGIDNFKQMQAFKFPYQEFRENSGIYELKMLMSKQNSDTTQSHIIRTIHRSRYSCLRKDMLSPIQYWERVFTSNSFLESGEWHKFYVNRLMNATSKGANEFRKTGYMTPEIALAGFTVTHKADCPSYFKPHLAKRLVSTYLSDFNEVFCPFNGFSGMMLGVAAGCKKDFIGQDINRRQIDESMQIRDFIYMNMRDAPKIELSCKDLFEDAGQYECLLACPPYYDERCGNIEKWNFDDAGNSLDKAMPCDSWIDECIKRYACKKYVFVVDDKSTSKYLSNVVEKLQNKSHFGTNSEYVVCISNDS